VVYNNANAEITDFVSQSNNGTANLMNGNVDAKRVS